MHPFPWITVTMLLTAEEASEVGFCVQRMRKDAEVAASRPTMTEAERIESRVNKIAAIWMVCARLECSVVAAKNIVEKG